MNYPDGMIPALGALPRHSGPVATLPERHYTFPVPSSSFKTVGHIHEQIRTDLSRIGEVGKIIGTIQKTDDTWAFTEVFAFVEGRMVECLLNGDDLTYRHDGATIDLSLFSAGYGQEMSGPSIPTVMNRLYHDLYVDRSSQYGLRMKHYAALQRRQASLSDNWVHLACGAPMMAVMVMSLLVVLKVDAFLDLGEVNAGLILLGISATAFLWHPARLLLAWFRHWTLRNAPSFEEVTKRHLPDLEHAAQRMCQLRGVEYRGRMTVLDLNESLSEPVLWWMKTRFAIQKPGDTSMTTVSNAGFHFNP